MMVLVVNGGFQIQDPVSSHIYAMHLELSTPLTSHGFS